MSSTPTRREPATSLERPAAADVALPDGRYYWRVRAADAAGNGGAWAAPWSFTFDTTPPRVPILLPPAGPVNSARPTLAWQTEVGSGAVSYDLEIAAAADFAPLSPAEMADIRRRAAEAVAGKGPCWWNPE